MNCVTIALIAVLGGQKLAYSGCGNYSAAILCQNKKIYPRKNRCFAIALF